MLGLVPGIHVFLSKKGWMAGTSLAMMRIRGFQPAGRQFEAFERKAGRDRAAAQRPVAERFGRLPGARRHRHLRDFVGVDIGAEPDDLFLGAVDQFET